MFEEVKHWVIQFVRMVRGQNLGYTERTEIGGREEESIIVTLRRVDLAGRKPEQLVARVNVVAKVVDLNRVVVVAWERVSRAPAMFIEGNRISANRREL